VDRSQTHEMMKLEIGAEAALFPEKEYINGIAIAVRKVRNNNNVERQICTCTILKTVLKVLLINALLGVQLIKRLKATGF
jgi:hypothetical protein